MGSSTIIETNIRELVARADLDYTRPVSRSEEGTPVGTGSMGSLVWTTPAAVKMQVNRVDVFACNRDTRSFRNSTEDYCNGCAYVDIDLVDYGDDVFAGPAFRQRLSVYDGVVTLEGKGVSVRVVASQQKDVLAIEVEDRRERPAAVSVDLRMLRYAIQYIEGQNWELTQQHALQIRTKYHTATSRLDIRGDCIVLTQEFREGDYYCASAVVAALAGRPAQARYASESTVRLSVEPGKGTFTILLASAASFDASVDVVTEAMAQLDRAGADFAAVHAANESFWQDFWSRSFIRMSSADGEADFVEQNYTYFFYLMASSSRGAFPPKFNGMLWVTTGDLRLWGSLYWWDNMTAYCRPLPGANHPELLAPFFRMYSDMAASCALAARQQWGSQGLYIPLTVFFDGLAELPEDIAAEMRQLYLLRKPWEQRSRRFMEFVETGQHRSQPRWNWAVPLPHNSYIEGLRTEAGCGADYPHYRTARRTDDGWSFTDRGLGPYGAVTHGFACGGELAHMYWKHFEHTQDRLWLRTDAYPMLKGVAEFYRNFPNMRKGPDGIYHLHGLTGGESFVVAQDKYMDVAALRTVTPILIRAAELLDADPELLPVWREFNEHLPPLPTRHVNEGIDFYLTAMFDFCYVETQDRQLLQAANDAFDRAYPHGTLEQGPDDILTRAAIAAAHLGRSEDVRRLTLSQIRAANTPCDPAGHGISAVLPNRLTIREGPGAVEVQRLGYAAEALQEALLQSGPPAPGEAPIIHVFPAWPEDWDAEYTLAARGGFLVTSAMHGGRIPFVELRAVADSQCCLRNPWGDGAVMLYRNGKLAGERAGSLLLMPMVKDEVVVVTPRGARIEALH